MLFFRRTKGGGVILAFLIIVVFAALRSPYFLSAYNLQALTRSLAFVGIIALGQACLLLIGELDLSVGSLAGFCGVIGGVLMVNLGYNPWLSFSLCLLLGAGCGFFNGSLVAGLNLNSLVVTVGMSGIYTGLNLAISEGRAITGIPRVIYFLGQGDAFGIPAPFLVMLGIAALILVLSQNTLFGRYMYAVGNNREAAKILGIRVSRVQILVFTMTGLLSALAGMVMVARLGSSQPAIGQEWVLPSIAASVIGGVSPAGGIGNPVGAVLGAAITAVIENIIVIFGISPYWQTAVSGVVVVAAVALDAVQRIIAEKRVSI
ncbi:MAG: ABC transporter permease [Candidatus Caldatribacteriaceae bacterium]